MTQDQYWVGAQLRQVAERVGAFLRFDKLCGGNGSYDGRVLGTDLPCHARVTIEATTLISPSTLFGTARRATGGSTSYSTLLVPVPCQGLASCLSPPSTESTQLSG